MLRLSNRRLDAFRQPPVPRGGVARLSARPEAPFRDLLDGLTVLVQRCLGGGRTVVLALDDDGSLQHVCPADAAPDLVARALARSGSSLRSVGGDPAFTPNGVAGGHGSSLCVPVRSQDQLVGVLYAEAGNVRDAFPPEFVARLLDVETLPTAERAADDPPSSDDPAGAVHVGPGNVTAATVPLRSLAELERDAILHALRMCRGNRTVTARALGISVRKLQYRLKEYTQQGIAIG